MNADQLRPMPRVLVWAGVLFALLTPVAVAAVLAAQPGEPIRWDVEWPRYLALVSLTLLPPAIAVLGLRYRRRGLLASAAILGLVVGVIAVPFGLLLWISVIAWAQAASRMSASTPAVRRVHGAALAAVPAVLALAAGVSLFVHQDPTCWTFEEAPDGTRVYAAGQPDPSQPSGFGGPGLTSTGSESSGSVEIDPETGAPLDATGPTTGETCTSDRVTPVEGAVSFLFSVGALGFAAQFGRPRDHDGQPVDSVDMR